LIFKSIFISDVDIKIIYRVFFYSNIKSFMQEIELYAK